MKQSWKHYLFIFCNMFFKPENRRRDDFLISIIMLFSLFFWMIGFILYDWMKFINYESLWANPVEQIYIQITMNFSWFFILLFLSSWILWIYFKRFFSRFCCRYPRFYFGIIMIPVMIIWWFIVSFSIEVVDNYYSSSDFPRMAITFPIVFIVWQLSAFWLIKRRLHDLNLSAWWTILYIVPVINVMFQFFLSLKSGTIWENKYWSDPLQMVKT